MRVTTYAWGISASLAATVAWFAGCGGNVNTNSGGTTGGGGQKTSTTVSSTTSTTTSSSSSSTTSTTSSSGTTGTTPCDMACAHIQMCTGFMCSSVGINCSTMGSMYDCEFTCAANTPCAQLGLGTLQTCQAQCAGDGGAGDAGPTDGGMMINACSACVGQSCTTAALACGQDASCMPWLTCTNACNSANPPMVSCFQACDAMYASAKALYDPVYACACSMCGTQCSAGDPCAHGMDGGP